MDNTPTALDLLAAQQPRPGRAGWLATFTGLQFVGFEATPDMIDPRDIAYGLAHKYRWCGQSDPAITVAEHSVLVRTIVHMLWPDREKEKAALLHDTVESWWVDVPAPIRDFAYLHLPDGEVLTWEAVEERILQVVGQRFKIDPALFNCPEVRAADILARSIEFRDSRNLALAGSPHLLSIPKALDGLECPFWGCGRAARRFLRTGRALDLWEDTTTR